jgi:exopolyphosphatase/guanosine-5'-triphosphate,3'-diphosphate pyrophosphatase
LSAVEQTPIRDGELMAAIDMGSNSFHLVVARMEHGEPRVIDRLRDTVRMAAGLRADGTLDAARRTRALHCLARFGQRIAGLPSQRVRAIGTNTLRQMAYPDTFLTAAEAALGHPIEIVSGREEGRLIFLGAAHDLPISREPRLVIDVGGGSTEFIIGRGLAPLHTESVQAGCIASTLRFFPGGRITAARWHRASTEIGVLLQQFAEDYHASGWQDAYGSSGTAKSIGSVLQAMALSDDGITAPALDALRDELIRQARIGTLDLPGLGKERAPVFPGGVVILQAAFAALGIERLQVCESSMREGLLWDLLGRAGGSDPRTASIDALATRYAVDRAQARRVEATAVMLFDQVAKAWQLDADAREWLSWSARVHEIGLAIAHSQHQHHGAYILRHADLAGFSRQEQQLLAAVIECHRRKPDKVIIDALPLRYQALARHITALLRLAVLFRRARRAESLPPLKLHATRQRLRIALPAQWSRQRPLSDADLQQEHAPMAELGLRLELVYPAT